MDDPSLVSTVSDFSGTFAGAATVLFGDATGSLLPGGTLTFSAADPFNLLFQPLTFGNSVSFLLTLPDSAPPLTPGALPSDFVVSLLDGALFPALPSTSPDDAALLFSLAPGQGPVLTRFTAAAVSLVPEPETYALVLLGLAVVVTTVRRSRRR